MLEGQSNLQPVEEEGGNIQLAAVDQDLGSIGYSLQVFILARDTLQWGGREGRNANLWISSQWKKMYSSTADVVNHPEPREIEDG